MLSDLFQDRALTPLPCHDKTANADNSKQSTASDNISSDKSSSDVTKEEATEREIVDILLAADLGKITATERIIFKTNCIQNIRI